MHYASERFMNICYVSRETASQEIPSSIIQLVENVTWSHCYLPESAITPLWETVTDARCAIAKCEVDRLNAEAAEAIVIDDFEVLATLTLAQLPLAPIAFLLPESLSRKHLRLLKSPLMQAACQLTFRIIAPNEAVKETFYTAIHWQKKDSRFLPSLTLPTPTAPLIADDELKRPLPASIINAWREDKLEFVGGGTRRQCYRLPEENLCIKCYRLDLATATHLKPSVHAEIGRMRHNRLKNTSCQEFDYFQQDVVYASEKVVAIFPNVLELFYLPECGWTLIEELLLNYDGSYAIKSEKTMSDTSDMALRRAIYDAVVDLKVDILKYNIKLYDPQNLLVQFTTSTTFQLRLTDFEPSSRALIKVEDFIPLLAKRKTKRRYESFIKRLSRHL